MRNESESNSETKNPDETRQAFARFARENGWKEPSPACPREEREAALHYLGLAWEGFRLGYLGTAAEHVRVAAAIVAEGERWEDVSIAS